MASKLRDDVPHVRRADGPANMAMHQGAAGSPLLDARSVTVHLRDRGRVVRAVDGVDLKVYPDECVGIVGESGSGKSLLGRSLIRLFPPVEFQELSGQVNFDGVDLAAMPDEKLAAMRRGRFMSMVFQDPLGHLNPTKRIGAQVAEARPEGEARAERAAAVEELLALVGLPRGARIGRRFPHELSGGMRQRVFLALALASQPQLLIADEPTTALDVTLQLHVLQVLKRLREEQGMALLIVTHDLSLVAEICDRVYVMYAGQMVEATDVFTLFEDPSHPYTAGLLASVPARGVGHQLPKALEGSVPDPGDLPTGCRFRPRCHHAFDRCGEPPSLRSHDAGGSVRCWLHEPAHSNEGRGVEMGGSS